MSLTTAATSSGVASGLTEHVEVSYRFQRYGVCMVHTDLELPLNPLPVLRPVIPLHLLVVLKHLHELLAQKSGLQQARS